MFLRGAQRSGPAFSQIVKIGLARLDAVVVDARVAAAHVAEVVELPVLVAVAAPPLALDVARLELMAQIELWGDAESGTGRYPVGVYVLPKHLDEKVARLHLDALGVKLSELTKEQADYIGVPVDGPYKPETYRY